MAHARLDQHEQSQIRFRVEGMHCAGCVNSAEKALAALPNVSAVQVNLVTEEARLELLGAEPAPDEIIAALEKAGYAYAPLVTDSAEADRANEPTVSNTQLIVAWLLAIAVMTLTMSGIKFQGRNWILLGLSAPLMFWCAGSVFFSAWQSARYGRANMDTLITLGSGVAFGSSVVGTVLTLVSTAEQSTLFPVHYEAAVMILAFILLGRRLEDRARKRSSAAIDKLIALRPGSAVVVRDAVEVTADIGEIEMGEMIIIRPGERIPLDAKILEGSSYIDESMLTGEPLPVEKSKDGEIYAGTLNGNGSLRAVVTTAGDATRLQQIIGLVRDAQGTRAPIARLADQVAAVFVPIVLGIAVVTFVTWMILGGAGLNQAIPATVSVLVIACPCALGLATPTAILVAMGKGAELGVLFRDGAILESTQNLDTLLMDKTGTLTEGYPQVTRVLPANDADETVLIRTAAAVESHSEHPLAEAILRYIQERQIKFSQASNFQSMTGQGAIADLDGDEIRLGNKSFLQQSDIAIPSDFFPDSGETPVFISQGNQFLGAIFIADAVRPASIVAIRALHNMGIEAIMLTGDVRSAAEKVAEKVGLDRVIAQAMPEQKGEHVRKLTENGRHVGMVGDGINDAPALAMADVGFAISSGTDIAVEAADVTLMRNDVQGVVDSIRLSRRTMRTIRQNLFFAFLYNVLGIPLAAGVLYPVYGLLLPPMYAAAAMATSSLCVVFNSLQLRRFQSAATD